MPKETSGANGYVHYIDRGVGVQGVGKEERDRGKEFKRMKMQAIHI